MENKNFLKKIFTGRRGRKLREYLTAYTFIAPATILIFIFGIFPVGFALFVSLHKWRIKRGDMIGLANYVKAIGNLAYVLVFFLGIGALIGVYFLIKQIIKLAKENQERPWLCIAPGLIFSGAVFALLNWFFKALPQVLDISFAIRSLEERTPAVFFQLLKEALRHETVLPAWRLFFWLLIAGVAISGGVLWRWRNKRNFKYQTKFALLFLALGAGVGLLYYTFQQINLAYTESMANGVDSGIWLRFSLISSSLVILAIGWLLGRKAGKKRSIWRYVLFIMIAIVLIVVGSKLELGVLPQVAMILGGVILFGFAWWLWRKAEKQDSNWRFILYLFTALVLLVGAWLLIGEIPQIVAQGDKDLWEGLKVTVFFSLGTVPFQLGIALFLSVLLFQKLKGSNIFRILFFIPYVTPAIASAAVFQQMFSNRQSAPVNMLLKLLGMAPQQWLNEPKGIIILLGEALNLTVPQWAAGPSLALIVIMLLSIWTYVGYDTVIYMAGLGNIPDELNDAAEVDGANGWQIFRYITFPLLSPTTYFLSLIAIIGTFKAFNTIWILRSNLALGTTDTFSVKIFVEFYEKKLFGYASAMSFVLFAIILVLTYINNKTQGDKVFYG